MLGGGHGRPRHLRLEPRPGIQRRTDRPGVAEPPQSRPLPRALRLITIEESRLDRRRAHASRGDRDRPLEDLTEVMVHRIFQHRPHHRVVGPERRETFPDGERDGGAALTGGKRSNGKQLVDVRVGMTPVHEAFPPCPEGQLATGHHPPLEIERARQAEPPVREGPPA